MTTLSLFKSLPTVASVIFVIAFTGRSSSFQGAIEQQHQYQNIRYSLLSCIVASTPIATSFLIEASIFMMRWCVSINVETLWRSLSLKWFPVVAVLVPCSVYFVREDFNLPNCYSTLCCQMLLTSQAILLHHDGEAEIPKKSLSRSDALSLFNILAYLLKIFPLYLEPNFSTRSFLIGAGCLVHALMIMAVIKDLYADLKDYEIKSRANNRDGWLLRVMERIRENSWTKVMFIIFTVANWVIFYAYESSHHESESLATPTQAYLCLLCATVVIVTVTFDRSLGDELTVAHVAASMNENFVRFISHELRSHMSHLTLGLQLLEEDIPPHESETLSSISDLQESCDSAMQILNDILIFHRC